MDRILDLLEEMRPDVDFEAENNLIDDGVFTSFDIFELIAALSDEYDIEINPVEIVPENFNSAKSIYQMMQRLLEQK